MRYHRRMLVLASQSPQRKTLLEGLGVSFKVVPSHIDEGECEEMDPGKRAMILATLKAREISKRHPTDTIIGCDTLVVSSSCQLLEKPEHANDALRMLKLQSGTVSVVHSAVTVIAEGKEYSGLSTSSVRFKKLSQREEEWWIGTKLWEGRSGAFQIDGPGQLMIEWIEGDWTGIVGLPIFLLGDLLQKAGAGLR
jgi:septum formation protein